MSASDSSGAWELPHEFRQMQTTARRFMRDARAGPRRIARVVDPDGNAALHRRCDGARMQHLCTERRELGGFVEAYLRDQFRALHDPRIRRQHPIDVGPDLDRVRAERGPDERGTVIGSAAA